MLLSFIVLLTLSLFCVDHLHIPLFTFKPLNCFLTSRTTEYTRENTDINKVEVIVLKEYRISHIKSLINYLSKSIDKKILKLDFSYTRLF
jgi:hypothetical protein